MTMLHNASTRETPSRGASFLTHVREAASRVFGFGRNERQRALNVVDEIRDLLGGRPNRLRDRAVAYKLELVASYIETGYVRCPHLIADNLGRCTSCNRPVARPRLYEDSAG
jgi:hypothetical protein